MDSPFMIALAPFAIFVGMLLMIGLRRVNCPDCAARLSAWQSPFTKTRRQWLEGGYLCRRCGCETDVAGHKIENGNTR
jgi:hypothetical protein